MYLTYHTKARFMKTDLMFLEIYCVPYTVLTRYKLRCRFTERERERAREEVWNVCDYIGRTINKRTGVTAQAQK